MSDLKSVEQWELDLLAENELSDSERAELFQRLNEHPQQWRNCALALMETQAICRGLQALATQNPKPVPTAHTPIIERKGRWASLVIVSLLAAVVGGAFGYGLSENSDGNIFVRSKVGAETVAVGKRTDEETALQFRIESILRRLDIGDENLLAVVQVEGNRGSSLVPVISSERLEKQVRSNPLRPLPPKYIQVANRKGWNVSQQQQLLTIAQPSAQTRIVPLHLMRLQMPGKEVL